MAKTKTDPGATSALDDEPFQLRQWGTDRVFALPPPHAEDCAIGSAAHCWLQVQDAEQFVSRHHATLRLDDGRWAILDAGSKNGLWIDGNRSTGAWVVPGMEIGVGRLRFVVESPLLVRRRALVTRFLGWRPERQVVVDRALRAIRELVSVRMPLVLTGSDDLVSIARRLHREVVGAALPFAVAEIDGDAQAVDESARSVEGGSLCLVAARLDAPALRALVADREHRCHVFICARAGEQLCSIDIPSLSRRADEIERIVDEYARDAIAEMQVGAASFVPVDRDWLLLHPPMTLAEIEVATRRLIAIRAFGGVTHAAPRLGVTHSALSRWLTRRGAQHRRRKSPGGRG